MPSSFGPHLCSVSSLVSVVNPSSPFSCNLLPAWRASPHWPAAGNPKLSTGSNTPTVTCNSHAAPTPLSSSYFLNLSENQPTKVSHIHYTTPLLWRNTLHSFVLLREKKSGSARDLGASALCCRSPSSLLPRSSQLIEYICPGPAAAVSPKVPYVRVLACVMVLAHDMACTSCGQLASGR